MWDVPALCVGVVWWFFFSSTLPARWKGKYDPIEVRAQFAFMIFLSLAIYAAVLHWSIGAVVFAIGCATYFLVKKRLTRKRSALQNDRLNDN